MSARAALNMLEGTYPDHFTFLQIHGDDDYTTTWGTIRRIGFYAPWLGYPSVFFGGEYRYVGGGNVDELYDLYHERYLCYQEMGTDVSIDVGAVQYHFFPDIYEASVQVCLDADGAARTVRVYLAHTLRDYPYCSYCTHTLMAPGPQIQNVHLEPGDCAIITRLIEFNAVSWSRREDIEILAWAQEPYSTWPAEIYNTAITRWPLTHLTPVGDLDCDGIVSFSDADGFICALSLACDYESMYPDCDRLLADCNRDGDVNAYDIDSFMDLLIGS